MDGRRKRKIKLKKEERKMGFILRGADRQQIFIKTVNIVGTLWLRTVSFTTGSLSLTQLLSEEDK